MSKVLGKRAKRGRPPVASKKRPYAVMLDPRYATLVDSFANSEGTTLQDLFRLALSTVVPNPFNSLLAEYDQVTQLREKAIAFTAAKAKKRSPVPPSAGAAKERRL